jgi:hypothetical protein
LRDRLRVGLSGADGVNVTELAEQIKALRAANTVEAAPVQTGGRKQAAEEPVTARIKRGESWQRVVGESRSNGKAQGRA